MAASVTSTLREYNEWLESLSGDEGDGVSLLDVEPPTPKIEKRRAVEQGVGSGSLTCYCNPRCSLQTGTAEG